MLKKYFKKVEKWRIVKNFNYIYTLPQVIYAINFDDSDAKVRDCVAYLEGIVNCFEKIPCVELLKILVSNDMFEKLNSKNYGIFLRRLDDLQINYQIYLTF